MTNHWNQSRNTFRTGEPEDHRRAKNIIAQMLLEVGYSVHKEYPLLDPIIPRYKHNYDVVAFGPVVIVEIDDPNLHSKPRKQANDKRAQSHAEEHFRTLDFIRLNKFEVNNEDEDGVAEYLQEELWSKLWK